MNDIKDAVYGETKNGKWYSCPNCGAEFDYVDVLNEEVAKRIDGNDRVYQCDKCGNNFRIPQ